MLPNLVQLMDLAKFGKTFDSPIELLLDIHKPTICDGMKLGTLIRMLLCKEFDNILTYNICTKSHMLVSIMRSNSISSIQKKLSSTQK